MQVYQALEMANNKKTIFNKLWLDEKHFPEYNWLDEVKGVPSQAFCKICKFTFSLSNMGKQALSSHTSSRKHQNATAVTNQQYKGTLKAFFSKQPTPNIAVADKMHHCAVDKQCSTSTESEVISSSMTCTDVRSPQLQNITGFVCNDDVTEAEIIWAIKCVMAHFSMNSCKDLKDIFELMFADSAIAKKITLGSTMIAYYITYGLAPYFHNELLRVVLKCSKFVVCFDEAMNRIVQRGQMDIVLRFWNNETNEVCSRYFGSAFLGQASAECLLVSFKQALTELPLSSLLQVSMDGPAVNWKFIDLLNTSLEVDNTKLLEMGSCGLHVIHGAFQSGHKASGWQVNAYLRALYGVFKDSPARRAQFTEITGSKVFPKKFCQVRWCENVSVAERALDVIPNVKKFVENTKKLSASVTSANINSLCSDKLAAAKISFFASVGGQCEPFFKKYQTSNPLAPFLYDDISNLISVLMKRFIKKSVIDKADSIAKQLKIDVNSDEFKCTYKEVDIGVAATKALANSKLSDAEKMGFRIECIKFLSAAVEKIIERSPLKYSIVRAISCLVPCTIANNSSLAEKRMKDLTQILFEKGAITATVADKCSSQINELCTKATTDLRLKFSGYSRCDRLDTFYYEVIGQDFHFEELFSVVCLVLMLSHGNASVESGFSVNSDMLVENLHEDSLVAQRTVYDAVKSKGGLSFCNTIIDKNLLKYVRGSNARYKAALEQKRLAASEEEKQLNARKRAADQIKVLKEKKARLMQDSAAEAHKIDFEIAELERLKK